MTAVTNHTFCGFQGQIALSSSGRSQVKFNPIPPNSVLWGKSRFNINQPTLNYELARPVKRSPIVVSSQSLFPVLAAKGNFANDSQLASSVSPPSPRQVPVPMSADKKAVLFLLAVAVLGILGLVKSIASGVISNLHYAFWLIRKWQIANKKALEKKILLEREDESVPCSFLGTCSICGPLTDHSYIWRDKTPFLFLAYDVMKCLLTQGFQSPEKGDTELEDKIMVRNLAVDVEDEFMK